MSAPPSVAASRPALRLVGAAASPGALPEPDPRDFDAVFRRYAPYIARVALRLLGRDGDEVDDLVQDTFLEAHRGIAQLREPGALRGWLSRICVRRATRRLRRRRLLGFFSLELVTEQDLPVLSSASPEQRLEVARVYRCLDRMPAEQRVVWILRHVEGESLEDLVKICACSQSTVQRRLRAAQQKMLEEVAS